MPFVTTNPGINKPWPLGFINVPTAGTPVQCTSNIGKTPECAQLWFQNTGTTTIYVMLGNNAFESTGAHLLLEIIAGAGPLFFNADSMGFNALNPADYWIDSSGAAGQCLVTAIQSGGMG